MRLTQSMILVLCLMTQLNAQEQTDKSPPPENTKIQDAMKQINTAYKTEITKATTLQLQKDLAKKFLADGKDTKDDTAGRYALFSKAISIAQAAGDVETAMDVIDEIDSSYQIDSLALKLDAVTATSKAVRSKEDVAMLASRSSLVADDAVAEDRYDIAKRAGDIEVNVCRRLNDAAALKKATQHSAWIQSCAVAFEKIKDAVATIKTNPTDSAAALAVGRYECFYKGDWENGLPKLSIGSDASLKSQSTADLNGGITEVELLKLADDWWDIAEKEAVPVKTQIQKRATKWYLQALPDLKGLAKARADSRLQSLENAAVTNRSSKSFMIDAKASDWTDCGMLAKGTYKITISGKVNLHDDEAAFIVGPEGREFGGHQIGTVTIQVGSTQYDSFKDGKDVKNLRTITINVAKQSKLKVKINDLTYQDNKGNYTLDLSK